jgi:hypothetical protein
MSTTPFQEAFAVLQTAVFAITETPMESHWTIIIQVSCMIGDFCIHETKAVFGKHRNTDFSMISEWSGPHKINGCCMC